MIWYYVRCKQLEPTSFYRLQPNTISFIYYQKLQLARDIAMASEWTFELAELGSRRQEGRSIITKHKYDPQRNGADN